MGVEVKDAGAIAKLLGFKIFVDEFISFRDLAILVKAGKVAVCSDIFIIQWSTTNKLENNRYKNLNFSLVGRHIDLDDS